MTEASNEARGPTADIGDSTSNARQCSSHLSATGISEGCSFGSCASSKPTRSSERRTRATRASSVTACTRGTRRAHSGTHSRTATRGGGDSGGLRRRPSSAPSRSRLRAAASPPSADRCEPDVCSRTRHPTAGRWLRTSPPSHPRKRRGVPSGRPRRRPPGQEWVSLKRSRRPPFPGGDAGGVGVPGLVEARLKRLGGLECAMAQIDAPSPGELAGRIGEGDDGSARWLRRNSMVA